MNNWIFIKEEPLANEFCEVKSEYCDPSDSYFTSGSEQSCDIKIENEEFPKAEKKYDDDAEFFYHPELSVKLIPLECSKNQEVKKYLKFLPSGVPLLAKCSTPETVAIELNKNVKTESVELETLTENTLARSSLEDTRYASPWDFVEVSDRYSQNNIETEDSKKKDSSNFDMPQTAKNEVEKTGKNFALENGDESTEMRKLNENSTTADNAGKTKLWECDICKKKFKKRNLLSQHMQTHYPKTYACIWCPRSYSWRSTLRRHAEIHNERNKEKRTIKYSHGQRNCTIVSVKKPKIDGKKNLVIEASNKLYKCDVCHERFEKKSTMRIHIEFLHIELYGEQIDKLKTTKPKRKNFRCMTCDKRYTQSSHLYRHEAIHSSDKTYNCDKCNVNFGRKSTLTRHMLRIHREKYVGRSKEKNGTKEESRKTVKVSPTDHVCKICKKSFKTIYDLRRHCAIHDRRKPYECDTCKKQFSLKSYLYAHVLTHDNWKPHPCDKCEKFYRRKSSLQRHVDMNHSGKKKNTCHICFKSYKHLPSYNAHMENHNQN